MKGWGMVRHEYLIIHTLFRLERTFFALGMFLLQINNNLDRKALGKIVFADHTLLEKLNTIVRPFLEKRIFDSYAWMDSVTDPI